MSLTQILAILQARRHTAFMIFALIVGTTLLLSLILPRQYDASTQIVIDLKPDPVNGGLPPGLLVRSYMSTQADIVSSERLRLMVVDRLSLDMVPANIEAFASEASSRGSIRQFIADKLARKLTVEPGRESTLLTIGYRAGNPQHAAEMANAFAQAFIDTNIEMRTQPASQRRDWYLRQSQLARAQLDSAQRGLTEYQREKVILAGDESQDVATRRLESLSASLTEASTQASNLAQQASQARLALASDNVESVPQIIGNQTIQQLRAERARLASQYNEQLTVLGKNHPQMRRIGNELWSVSNRIKVEAQTIILGMEKARDNALASSKRLTEELASQKGSLLTEKNVREKLSLLQRDVSNAQRAYDDILTQLNQTSLQSASTYANVFVMSEALPPNRPSSPNLLINLAAAVFLGTLLAIGLTVLTELRGRRVYNRMDVEQATGRPIIGTMSEVARSLTQNQRKPLAQP